MIGICRRRVLTELIRTGLLPYPDGPFFKRVVVERVVAYYEERRQATRAKASRSRSRP